MTRKSSVRQRRLPFALLLVLAGCESLTPEPAPPPRSPTADDTLLAGTIGAETLLANPEPRQLRGFGLVVGLDGRGSSDCPTVIREYLIDFLGKQLAPQGSPDRRPRLSPAELIDSLDTAVVEVTGSVPAGGRKGTRFDLEVRAVAGTSTESLEGGLLLPTQLRIFDRAASGQGLIAGSIYGEGGGPVFINPFMDSNSATTEADLRHGSVLGGGRATEEYPTRLMLLRPNYALAQSIERRVNERFGPRPKAAEAMSAGFIELKTPPAFGRDPQRFRELVTQLYVDNRPAATEQRLSELNQRAIAGDANLERIAATWEAVGRSALAQIQPLYTHADPTLRYYAARTGLHVGDLGALPVLAAIATSASHSHRLLAIRELGGFQSPQSAVYLGPLVNDPDQEVRIAAYEALLQRGHPVIRSVTFRHVLDHTQISFILDVVESTGAPLIYVRRTRLPRIAVFGSRMSVASPVFYSSPDESVTIHTVEGSKDVQLFAKRRGRLSESILLPPRAADLITALGDLPAKDDAGRLRGIGLPYSRVVQLLAALCKDETISAHLVFEQTSMSELFGPDIAPDRPEGGRMEAEEAKDTE